jgi:hypothetical protein
MRVGALLWVLGCVLLASVMAWNGMRFVGAKAQPRTKDLDFLPPPVVAQALACGQQTALAKLRWIDSFAYFQFQLERLNDTVAGEDRRGGFERLYETLIAMDPYFRPFYEQAVLNTGGVLTNHHAALGFIMRGLISMPHDSSLWRLASAELAVSFGWSKREPVLLDRWLNAWAAAELDEGQRQQAIDWRRGLAFTDVDGLQTLPYWIEQLRSTKPGTPLAEFVEGTVRELLAEHGAKELAKLLGLPSSSPMPNPAIGNVESLLSEPLLPLSNIVIPSGLLRARWPRGAPVWAPVHWDGREGGLRSDPFGHPWRLEGGRIVSPGREQRRFLVRVNPMRLQVEAEAQQRGRVPRDLVEVAEWGIALPEPPYGGHWSFEQRMPDVIWPEPPQQPWPLR